MTEELPVYGSGDGTYQALGGLEGIKKLVSTFYQVMSDEKPFRRIRNMHPADLTLAQEKLIAFLSGWSGGPKLYAEKYGAISLPVAHKHLPINEADKNAWLDCMAQALQQLGYDASLSDYLLSKFAIPAESIRLMCQPTKMQESPNFYSPL